MTYPVLSARQAMKVAELIISSGDGADTEIPESEHVTERDGDDYDRDRVEADSAALRSEWEKMEESIARFSADDLYVMEILFSAKIYQALRHLGIDHREDEDFWRYLALFPYRWYLMAREGKDLKPQNYGGLVEGSIRTEEERETVFVNQVLYRAFVIGRAIRDESHPGDPYSRASAIPRGGPVTDFWHSHVLRVQIGRIGHVCHSLVDAMSSVSSELMKEHARNLAKLITRLKSNVLLDGYSKQDMDDLFVGFGGGRSD